MKKQQLRYALLLITLLNLPLAFWIPLAGMFTFETWPMVAGLLLWSAMLVFNGSAWALYARGRSGEAEKRLRLILLLDLLCIALLLFFYWRHPGFRDWQ